MVVVAVVVGHREPLGTPAGTTLIEDPGEQNVIVEILEVQARGVSMAKIAQGLAERGVRTERGGTQWAHKTVAGIWERCENVEGPMPRL